MPACGLYLAALVTAHGIFIRRGTEPSQLLEREAVLIGGGITGTEKGLL